MAFEIEVGDGAGGGALEFKCTPERERDRRSPLLAVGLEVEGLQELIVLGEVVDGEVDVQRGERVTDVDAEHAGSDEAGAWRLQGDALEADHLRLAVVVPERLAGDGDVAERAWALDAGGREGQVAVDLYRLRDVGGGAAPLDLHGAADGGVKAE